MQLFTLSAKRMSAFALALVLASSLAFSQWSAVGSENAKGSPEVAAHAYLNGKLYVFGGITNNTISTGAYSCDVTTPGAAWKTLKTFPANRYNLSAVALNGKIYIMGGRSAASTYSNSVWEYDPVADTYTAKAAMKTGVGFAATCAVNGKIYVLGGYSGKMNSLVQVYDPATNTWSLASGLLVAIANASATVVDSTIYVVGGEDGSSTVATVQVGQVSGKTISWSTAADMPAGRTGVGAGTIGGHVFVMGGNSSDGMTGSCYKYDAVSDSWSAGYSMPFPTAYLGSMDGDGTSMYALGGSNMKQPYCYKESGVKNAIAYVAQPAVYDSLRPEESNSQTFRIQNLGVVPLTLEMSTPEKDSWCSLSMLETTVPAGGALDIEVSFDATGLKSGFFNSNVTLKTNDPNQATILVPVQLGVFETSAKRVHLLEMFTSSTCPPCKLGNETLNSVLSSIDESMYATVKYQESWPTPGDPYCTIEGSNRGGFYGVGGIPFLAMNGKETGISSSIGDLITSDTPPISLMNMKVSSNIDINSKTVNLKVDLDPLYDHNAENNTLYVAICEQLTKRNVKNNGETQFEHVVKKMLPDENGTRIGAVKAGSTTSKTYSYSFPGKYRLPADAQTTNWIKLATENSVEDFNNLEVIVWMQDPATHNVYNSARSVTSSGVDVDMENVNSLQLTDCVPNPASNFASMKFYMPKGGRVTAEVVDVLGNTVRTLVDGYREKGESQLFVDASTLTPGFYQVVLKSAGRSLSSSFVVSH